MQLSTLAAKQLALSSTRTSHVELVPKHLFKLFRLPTQVHHFVQHFLWFKGDFPPCFGVRLKHSKVSAFRVHSDADSSMDIGKFLQANSLVHCPRI